MEIFRWSGRCFTLVRRAVQTSLLICHRWLRSNKEKTGRSTKCNIPLVAALLTFLVRSLRTDEPDKEQSRGKCGSSPFQERRPNRQKDGLIDVGEKEEAM